MTGFGYIGYGAIMVPVGVESRDSYVQECLTTKRVSILNLGGGQIIHDCYITNEVLNNINFPTEVGGLGSRVVYVMRNINNVPTIIGTLEGDQSLGYGEENQWGVLHAAEGDSYSLIGSLKQRLIAFVVSTKEKSRILLRAMSSNGEAEISTETNGKISHKGNKILLKSNELFEIGCDDLSNNKINVKFESTSGEFSIYNTGDDNSIQKELKLHFSRTGYQLLIKDGDTSKINISIDGGNLSMETEKVSLSADESGNIDISNGDTSINMSSSEVSINNGNLTISK